MSSTNEGLQGVVWALAVAVIGLVLREAWQAWRAARDQRQWDRALLSALLREVSVIQGLASGVVRDVARESELLTHGQWRLKALAPFPLGIYDLVKDRPPRALLEQAGALRDLARLQVQCSYTNALADELQKWKMPAGVDPNDRVATIASLHPAVYESVNTIIERCERLSAALRKAGVNVGGLNLEGPPDERV